MHSAVGNHITISSEPWNSEIMPSSHPLVAAAFAQAKSNERALVSQLHTMEINPEPPSVTADIVAITKPIAVRAARSALFPYLEPDNSVGQAARVAASISMLAACLLPGPVLETVMGPLMSSARSAETQVDISIDAFECVTVGTPEACGLNSQYTGNMSGARIFESQAAAEQQYVEDAQRIYGPVPVAVCAGGAPSDDGLICSSIDMP